MSLSTQSSGHEQLEEVEDLETRLKETKDELESLLDSYWFYAKRMLKFGFGSWVFSLSLFISIILLLYGPSLVLSPPSVSISLLMGGLAVILTVSAGFLTKKRRRIRELREKREKFESAYERTLLESKWEEAKERNEFLDTLLRQDLRSKFQFLMGSLQLLEEDVDVPEESKAELEDALRVCGEAHEILNMVKELGEIEETEWVVEEDILKILRDVLERVYPLAEERGVEIVKNYLESGENIRGDYSVNTFISQILKIRIRISGCDKVRISVEEEKEKILLRIEDDGEVLPEYIKRLLSGEVYKGKTTGSRGVQYYMIRQIVEHNNADITAQDSELGGARFDIQFQKA